MWTCNKYFDLPSDLYNFKVNIHSIQKSKVNIDSYIIFLVTGRTHPHIPTTPVIQVGNKSDRSLLLHRSFLNSLQLLYFLSDVPTNWSALIDRDVYCSNKD